MNRKMLEPVADPTGDIVAGVPFKRLLVPLDGSEQAERALPFAQSLARTLGADLILARAAEVGPTAGDLDDARIKASAEAQAYLQRLAADYRTDYALEYSVPFGDPATEIPQVAEVRAADLIVMATRGRGGLSRLLFGSVADALIRRTRVSLLLVRSGLPVRRWERGLRRILVPLDGSVLAEQALARVGALAATARAHLTLLQVVGPVLPGLSSFEIAQLPVDDGGYVDQAREYLREVAAPLVRRGLDVQIRVAFGTPGDQIVAHAEGYDLIAMATHGRGGVERLVVGSVADQVARTADLPVLLLRE